MSINCIFKDIDKNLCIAEYKTNASNEDGEMLLIQPTSPLRFFHHINSLMKMVRNNNSKQCVAVRDVTKYFLLANQI